MPDGIRNVGIASFRCVQLRVESNPHPHHEMPQQEVLQPIVCAAQFVAFSVVALLRQCAVGTGFSYLTLRKGLLSGFVARAGHFINFAQSRVGR